MTLGAFQSAIWLLKSVATKLAIFSRERTVSHDSVVMNCDLADFATQQVRPIAGSRKNH